MKASGRAPVPVRAVKVRLYTPQTGQSYSASLTPVQQVTLAFRASGIVEFVSSAGGRRLEAGDLVVKGSVLARLRAQDSEIALSEARGEVEAARQAVATAIAQVSEADAMEAKASSTWTRANTLYEARALTAPDWEAARAQRDVATAQAAEARSRLAAAKAQETRALAGLSSAELAAVDSSLIAPITGRVIQRSLEVGSLISAGQPAFVIADTARLKAAFGIPDGSLAALKNGQHVSFSAEAVPERFTGTISSISAAADPSTRLFLVEAMVTNARDVLRPGMIATVFLHAPTTAQAVTVVPLSAIIRSKSENDGFSVVMIRNGHAVSSSVTLAATYGDLIAVSGVQTGELVVVSGASLLTEGEAVEVIQ